MQVFHREFIRGFLFADVEDSKRSLDFSLEANNYPNTAETAVELVARGRYPEKKNGEIRIEEIEQRHNPLIAASLSRAISTIVHHCESRYVIASNRPKIPREFFVEPLKDIRIGYNEYENKFVGFFFELPTAKPAFRMKVGDVKAIQTIASELSELQKLSEE